MSNSLLGRGVRSDAEVALERLLQLSNAKDALDVLLVGTRARNVHHGYRTT